MGKSVKVVRAFACAVIVAVLGSSMLAAQEVTGSIEGRVTILGSGAPLQNAQVFITGTQVGALTGPDGRYRLVNVLAGNREIRVRLIGYSQVVRTVVVPAGQSVRADFELSQAAIELGTVVTMGTGGMQTEERKLGNTVATIEPPPDAPITSFSDIIQGREPGLSALPSSGLAGEGSRIRIRGNASMSQSNEPIVYVDGIRMDNGGGFGNGFVGTGGGGQPSRLDDIDPSSIEKVEILKGAAAATIYGTEASNGVIQIFTKRGTTGAPRWNFGVEQAATTYPTARLEPNWGFARSDTQAARLSDFYGRTITAFQPFSQNFTKMLFETGRSTTLNGSVSGGTPLFTYFVSGRSYREDGAFTANRFNLPASGTPAAGVLSRDINNRYQGTANLGLHPGSRFHLNVRTSYSHSHNEVPDNNNSIYSPYTLLLFSQPQRAECNASRDSLTDPTFGHSDTPGRCRGPGNPTGSSTFATIREALQREIKQDTRHFNGVIKAQYIPIPSLAFDGIFGVDYAGSRSTSFLPFGNNLDFRTNQANEGEKNVDNRTHQEVTLSGNGNWTAQLGRMISSSLLFGAQGYLTRENDESGTNTGFPGPGIEVVGGGSLPQVFETFSSTVNAGFFAQEQLGFNDWVFGTVGARYDYNSAFGEEAGGVMYPKASISIIPSDMPGWRDNPMSGPLSTLRVRAAVGQAGRQPSAFAKLTTYEPLTSEFGSGLVPANLGNPELKPEIATEWEVGAEVGLFENRTALEFTRWNRVLNDALVSRQFPVTGGFIAQQLDNVGQMKAFGWEASIRAFPVTAPRYSVELFANTAFLSQVVTDLGGAPPLKVGGSYPRYRNFIIEGLPPGALLGAEVIPNCASGQTTTRGGGPCLLPGQLPFDTDKNGVPDTEAEMLAYLAGPRTVNNVDPIAADDDNDGNILDHYQGKPYPDYQGSFGGTLTFFRNWRFGTLFEYKAGRYTVTDLTGGFRRSNNTNGGNTELRARTEATLLNPASTPQQRLEAAKTWAYDLRGLTPYDGLNQNFPGDFLRLRELSLTYTTPVRFADRLGASDVAITFSARNLALWTKYPGPDPEVNVYGRRGEGGVDNNFGDAIDAFGFPLPRRFALSIRAGF